MTQRDQDREAAAGQEADPSADPKGMEQELARLRAENEALKKRSGGGGRVSMKVSDKGGVSVYGLGRFPVTLYLEQWEALLSRADEIRAFIEANRDSLKKKE